MKKIYIAFLLLAFITNCYATEYFVNSVSGNDANNGVNSASPWQSLTPVKNTNFQPGDIINFARGSAWFAAAFELS